jgi:hypothetical protein
MAISDQDGAEPSDRQSHGPAWDTPHLYGEAEALNSMGTIAAPLLGGFSLAAMVQTTTIGTGETRWPDAALLLFLLAAVLFVTAVQAMFWARSYQTTPKEIQDWWPDATDPNRLEKLRDEQRWHAKGFRMWADRARATYNAAMLCLLAALTLLAVPAQSHVQTAFLRWLAVAVGGVAFIAETTWIVGSFRNTEWIARLLQPSSDHTVDSSNADHDAA